MSKTYSLLSVGLSQYDVVVRPVPDDLMTAESMRVDEIFSGAGGGAFTAAAAFAAMGEKPALVSSVGNDDFAITILQRAKDLGLDTSYVKESADIKTKVCFTLQTHDGERHMAGLTGDDVCVVGNDDVPGELLSRSGHLHVGGVGQAAKLSGEELDLLIARAKEAGLSVSATLGYDVEEKWLGHYAGVVSSADMIFCDEYVAEACGGSQAMAQAGAKLFAFIREDGSVFATDFTSEVSLPSFFGEVVDLTGLEDAFSAGFIFGRLKGLPLEACAALGAAQAACCAGAKGAVTRLGDESTLKAIIADKGYNL
ncbi:MAG: carbohydrate kinase family protein [Christensenellales bacterium]|jgi:sugar/nucleoside kinase (ribokinase family)